MTASGFLLPRSTDEAVGLLREHGDDLVVLGGGTIVMGLVNDGLLFPGRAMSLARAGLDGVREHDGHVAIGATTTLATIEGLTTLPMLASAARTIGAPAVRTVATVGGNLFAHPPYGDLAVALLALDAQVELDGAHGRRALPLETFLEERSRTGANGRQHAVGSQHELVTGLLVPRPRGQGVFLKLARRQANAASVVAVAVQVLAGTDGVCREARIALGAAGPHPLRARAAEAALVGQPLQGRSIEAAAAAAMAACDPFTDALASAWYRRKMVGVYVRRALESLIPNA